MVSRPSCNSEGVSDLIRFLCSAEAPFLRPDLQVPTTPRAADVKAGRRSCLTPNSALARPRLDGHKHGVILEAIGRIFNGCYETEFGDVGRISEA